MNLTKNLALFSSGILIAILLALLVGKYPLTPTELLDLLVHSDTTQADPRVAIVFWQIRLPRILAALMIGAALSAAGAAYQGMFRNPLVSPDILGVSAGAGMGACVAMWLGLPIVIVQLLAFVGGMLAVALTCLIASMAKRHDPVLSLVLVGIAIGTLCGLADPLWMAVLLAAVFALLVTYVRRKSNMASDTVIGVFSSTAVALGIFIATFGGGSFTQYNSLLIGDILSVEPAKIALLAVILLVVVLLWLCSFNQLMLSSIHPALADSRGVGVFWQEAVFSAAIAVVVTVSMTWVGLLVINSLLVLPAAAARNLARNMRQYHLFSLLGAVLAGVAGLMTSYHLGPSAGASITLYLAVWFALSFLLRKKG